LLEDGLTIRSNSNQPGKDLDVQEHTLFALGSNVPCLFLNTNTYGEESDTSYAAPHVSGAAAIVMSQFPTLSAKDVSKCLREGATPILLGTDGLPYELTDCDAGTAITIYPELEGEIKRSRAKYGMGRLNIRGALERAEKMWANSQR
jgi:subtilisin family serine protease